MSRAGHADLLVAGGGPAGALLALAAARAGVRVILLDRAVFPRPKPCGGVLSPRAVSILEEAGALRRLLAAGAQPITRLRVHAPDGAQLTLPYGRGLALERERLDLCLLEEAAAAGAEIRTGVQVEALEPERGRRRCLRFRLLRSGRLAQERGVWVAGAGGSRCRVRRALEACCRRGRSARWSAAILPTRRRRSTGVTPPGAGSPVAVCAVFDGIGAPGEVCEMHLLGDGYCGVAAAGPDRTAIGMVLSAAGWREFGFAPLRDPDSRLDRVFTLALAARPALAAIAARLRLARGPWASGALRTLPPRGALPGTLLVGDALARMEPITGEGMAEALAAARRAAHWIVRGGEPCSAGRLHRLQLRRLGGARRRSALAATLSRLPRAAAFGVGRLGRLPGLAGALGRHLAGEGGAPAGAPAALHPGEGRA